MLDLKWIRRDAEEVRARLAMRGAPERTDAAVDGLVRLDEERRALIAEGEALKARRNVVTREISERKRAGDPSEDVIAEMRAVADRIREIDGRLREVEQEVEHTLLRLPNVPDPDLPLGGEESNQVVREWGRPVELDFEPKPHWELGASLGLIDLSTGARVTGSGFVAYTGAGARLQRALINWMLDLHREEHGYTEASPPYLVNQQTMQGTGQYPKFVEDGDAYEIPSDGLYLIPTAEVPITNFHREELLDGSRLPLSYVAYSPCFRREAGAAGKDTRGLLRVHQFDKVELVRFERPEDSAEALEKLTAHAERVLQLLGLPYRVVLLAAGDLGFSSRRTYDLEVWAAGVGKWLEVSSCSNCGDYQARRAEIRFRPAPGEKPEYVHTLNGSGVALPRTIVALIENYQQPDGSVVVPEVLRPYVGTDRFIP
ncbi:MAG TPA: serine--tRNA ligase [Longimicrobiaceae bacterium]